VCSQQSHTTHQGGVAQVVQATLLEDGSTSLPPDGGITELNTIVVSQQLRGDHAQGTQQGPAGVDQLQLTVTLEGLLQERRCDERHLVNPCWGTVQGIRCFLTLRQSHLPRHCSLSA